MKISYTMVKPMNVRSNWRVLVITCQWHHQDFEPGSTACMFTKSGRNHRNSYIDIKTLDIYVTCGSVLFKDMIMIQKHTGYKLSRWFRRSPTRQPSIDISVQEAWVRSLVWHKFYFFCFT